MLTLTGQKGTTTNFAYARPLFWAPNAVVDKGRD